MLTRAQTKVPIRLMIILTILAFLSTSAAIGYSTALGYIGFMMNPSNATMCSIYATYKLQINITYIYNAILIGGGFAVLVEILILGQLIYLLVKHCQEEDNYFMEMTQTVLVRLYVGYSCGLLGLMIGVGYYASYIIEEGINCLNSLLLDWLILGALFVLALISMLICWIYLFIFKVKVSQSYDRPTSDNLMIQVKSRQDVMEKQPTNMMDLFREIIIQNKQQQKTDIKQPLLEQSIAQSDKFTEPDDVKEKVVHMTFEDYKKKEEEQEKKKIQKEKKDEAKRLEEQAKQLKLEEEKYYKQQKVLQMKQKITEMALSPGDPGFDDIFLQSDNEQEKEQKQLQQEQKRKQAELKQQQKLNDRNLFPANFIPANQEENIRFQEWKKRMDEQQRQRKKIEKDIVYKHPQNMNGGRSKRIMKKFMQQIKRPVRSSTLIKERKVQISDDLSMLKEESSLYSESPKSATFYHKIKPVEIPAEVKPIVQTSPKTPKSIQVQPDGIFFIKQKTKSPNRIKLFQEEQSYYSDNKFGSILGNLVKGVIETQHSDRLKRVKKLKQKQNNFPKIKKNQKLIDFIRSRYD